MPEGNHPFGMKAGGRYVMDNAMAADYLKNGAPGTEPKVEDFASKFFGGSLWELLVDREEDAAGLSAETRAQLKPKRVLIIRAGGIGDLLFLTPALVKLVERFPEHEFAVCAIGDLRPVVCHPRLERVGWVDYPPLMKLDARCSMLDAGLPESDGLKPELRTRNKQDAPCVEDFDLVVALEETVEADDERDAVTIFAEVLGVPLEDHQKLPLLRIPSDALAAAMARFPKEGMIWKTRSAGATRMLAEEMKQRRIGIQLRASHDCRSWPLNYILPTAALLLEQDKNCVVFFFGKASDFPGIEGLNAEQLDARRIVWLPGLDLSLGESLAVLGLMDGFIGPDSGLLHAAGALGIPSVGIFGPYKWQQRTVWSPSIRGINGHAPCAPCHHKARMEAFPPGMECAKVKCCLALAQVTPDRVVALIKRQMAAGSVEAPRVEHVHAMGSFFGQVSRKGDVHLELAGAPEFHLGDWGMGGASIEEAKFLYALVLCLKPHNCLETGTETGWTAAHIAKALEENGKGHLLTLETDEKKVELANENLKQWDLWHRVTVMPVSSFDYLAEMSPTPIFDFALLDTHIELREEELRLLIPHLTPGAWVLVHDTSPEHPMRGETRLLEALRAVPGFDVVQVPSPRGLTVMCWRGVEKEASILARE